MSKAKRKPHNLKTRIHLEEMIEHCYKEPSDSPSLSRMVASGWIAIPEVKSMDEQHAARILETVAEEEPRLQVRPSTRQVLADLME